MSKAAPWPDIPYADWRETCTALHLYAQIFGKYRLAQTPWLNHSWHATFYVSPHGLTTGPIPYQNGTVELKFDLQSHRVIAETSDGRHLSFDLEPMSVADFYGRTERLIVSAGGTFNIHGQPSELPDPVPFGQDTTLRPYDADAVSRYHDALCRISGVFAQFRTGFIGKSSPVHLFWGAFDLAVTRFSGRTAPLHPGSIPNLPDIVTQEAYSHEVSSAGFWPGGGGVDEAMFYSYAYPTPDGFKDGQVKPDAARFDQGLGEFVLPYEAMRTSADPAAALMEFLRSTYATAADLADWDHQALECDLGRVGSPRKI